MSTTVPWFRYGLKELKRHIRWLIQHRRHAWDTAEWDDALRRALRLREKRLRGKEREDRCRDPE